MTFRTFFYDILFSTFRSASEIRSQKSKNLNILDTFLILLKLFGLVIFRTKLYQNMLNCAKSMPNIGVSRFLR